MTARSSSLEKIQPARGMRVWGAVVAAIIGMLLSAPASVAQDQDKTKAGLEVWKNSGCSDCHGSFANGEKERDESPSGANLRTTRLDAAELKVVISCGKPGGAGMPAFDEGAYKVRACYGRPLGARPDDLYPSGVTLTPAQIDAVIAYLQARIIGRGRITKQECLAYYEDRPDECDDIK